MYLYSEHIFSHTQHVLRTPLQMYTPRHARTSGPLTVAGLAIMIPPVKCDPAAWSCIECNGHREFQVSSDKWPGLAVDQRTRGLFDLSLQLQTLTQPLGLSAGSCTLPLFFPPTCSYCIPALFIPCNFKPKSKAFFLLKSILSNIHSPKCPKSDYVFLPFFDRSYYICIYLFVYQHHVLFSLS